MKTLSLTTGEDGIEAAQRVVEPTPRNERAGSQEENRPATHTPGPAATRGQKSNLMVTDTSDRPHAYTRAA